jgi:hypothetical protein
MSRRNCDESAVLRFGGRQVEWAAGRPSVNGTRQQSGANDRKVAATFSSARTGVGRYEPFNGAIRVAPVIESKPL